MADPSITVRIKQEYKDEIQRLVDSDEYRSITDFIDRAIKEKLERNTSDTITIESLQSQINHLTAEVQDQRRMMSRIIELSRFMDENESKIEK